MEVLRIRNEKTGKVYSVTSDGWASIEKAGWASRYTVLERRALTDKKQPSFLPKEIAEKAKSAAEKALEAGTKEQPGAAGARQS